MMNMAGQFNDRAAPAQPAPALPPVTEILRQGLDLVEDLSRQLQCLDSLMLTGKPNDISDAAAGIEAALKAAGPAFAEITETMARLGACNLAAAAAQLRKIEEADAAGLAEALRAALSRFAKKSVSANRRAQQLNRGLNAALKSLAALGVQESGRLIAEA
ncbi:hypothetical protein [Acidocella sp.]|uniref:hypothetical protein n=1 Tax=Acidocella sp. TaxID=50710 RepID=UPI002630F25F|nr:hypothetical protein [Acidocella sp.]